MNEKKIEGLLLLTAAYGERIEHRISIKPVDGQNLELFRNARNTLAHMKRLSFDEVKEILKLEGL